MEKRKKLKKLSRDNKYMESPLNMKQRGKERNEITGKTKHIPGKQ